jgi:hypothetical protein
MRGLTSGARLVSKFAAIPEMVVSLGETLRSPRRHFYFQAIVVQAGNAATVFTSDFSVVDGDYYFSLEAQNNAHAKVLGGTIENRLQFYHTASGEVHAGWVNSLYVGDSATAAIYSGSYINTYLGAYGNSVLDLYGGRMPDRWLTTTENAVVNFYVRNYDYEPNGGQWGDGSVTGTWADNTTFAVDLKLADTFSHLVFHQVPEPNAVSLSIVGLSCVAVIQLLRRRRRGRATTSRRRA